MTRNGGTAFALALAITVGRGELAAQSAQAEAIGAKVQTAAASLTAPRAVLGSGNYDADSAPTVGLAGLVSAENAFARTTGMAEDPANPTAESVSTLENVNILGGVVTADLITAMASSAISGSNAEGSSFANLRVGGAPVDAAVAPNTSIDVPGVGTVVLNEQIASATGITVNMIRVILKNALTGATTGTITVASASTAVSGW